MIKDGASPAALVGPLVVCVVEDGMSSVFVVVSAFGCKNEVELFIVVAEVVSIYVRPDEG